MKVNRSKDHDAGPLVISDPFAAVAGMLCPDTLPELREKLHRGGAVADGWADRFLFAYPERFAAEAEHWRSVPAELEEGYAEVIADLLGLEQVPVEEAGRVVGHRPYYVRFDASARAAWEAFTRVIATTSNSFPRNDPYCGVLSKLKHYGVRFACLFYCLDRACGGGAGDVVTAAHVERAACVVWYFEAQERRCLGIGDRATEPARRVLALLAGWGERSFTKREVYRRLRNQTAFRRAVLLDAPLELLTQYGFIAPQAAEPRGGKVGRPAEKYDINPLWDRKSPPDAPAETAKTPTPPPQPPGGSGDRATTTDPAETRGPADETPIDAANTCSAAANSPAPSGGGTGIGPVPAGFGRAGGDLAASGQGRNPFPESPPADGLGSRPGLLDPTRPPCPSGHDARPPAAAEYTLITTTAGLTDVVAAVEDVGTAGIDTETTGLDPRTAKVRLLQVAAPGATFVIDLFALPDPAADLTELFEALGRVTVVGHNLAFDLGFLSRLGFTPGSAFDTMLAATVLSNGTEERSSDRRDFDLAAVAQWMLGRTVVKGEQRSDWSRPDLSPAQLAYAAADAAVLLPLAERLREEIAKSEDTAATIDLEMRALLCAAWAAPVKVDEAAWLVIADGAAEKGKQLAERMNEIVPKPGGLFDEGWNWNSPDQVKAAFAVLGLTLEGTDDDDLAAIKTGKGKPLADLLRQYRAEVKLAGTYGRKWVEDHVVSGGVRPRWNQLGAGSGRMSCSKPNLQQIPRDNRYRKCFIAGPGRVLVKADYSQIELRVAAKVAGEKVMLAAYAEGRDLHTMTAARLIGKSEAEVKKTDRQLAKAVNFGLLYGMGAVSLQAYADANYGVKLSEAEAKKHRDTFFATYPGLKLWHDRTRELLKRQEKQKLSHRTRTQAGRVTLLPAAKEGRNGPYPNLNEASNFPVQGTAADGLKAAMALLWERRAEMPDAVPVLFVHDEVVLEVPEADGERAAAWLKGIMVEGIAPLIAPVPVEVEVTVGKSWGG